MRYIAKIYFQKCLRDFSKAFFIGSDKTILVVRFCLGKKKLVEVSINCHDTWMNITVQSFEVAWNFYS